MNYAQILDGGEVNIIVIDSPEMVDILRNAGMTIIDISEETPTPQVGWTWTETDGFTPGV